VLRAAGQFVCFYNLAREVLFARTNRFYYQMDEAASDEKKRVCNAIMHDDVPNIIQSTPKVNHNGVLELATPNTSYLVFFGCLLKIIHRPEKPVEFRNKLFVLLKDENPAFIEQLSD